MPLRQWTTFAVLGIIFLGVGLSRLFPPVYTTPPEDERSSSVCRGEAIVVDFAYLGTVNEPWTCQPQCNDGKERYILYTNGKATQCQDLPGCNDTGEDTGVTCIPPDSKPLSGTGTRRE